MIKNILCVHENEYFIKALSNILLRYDLFASGFVDSEEACDFALKFKNNIDLVIADEDAGGKGRGFDLISKLKNEIGINAPAIGLITEISLKTLESAEDKGINLLLPKNIDEKSLLNHIKKFDGLWEASNPAKILIADADPFRLKKNVYELKGGNFNVLESSSGKASLEAAVSEKPDLIILNDELDSPDIYETARALRANKRTMDIPVIILSDNIDAELKKKGVMSGIVDFRLKTNKSGEFLWYVSDIINSIKEKKYKTGMYFSIYPVMAHVVKYIMAFEGYDIITTSNCAEGQRIMDSGDIDFILCDIGSRKKREDIEKCIKNRGGESYVPVIVIAGPGDYDELMYGLNTYADDFVKTPFIPEELTKRIYNQVRMKETVDYVINQNKNLKMLSITDILTGTYNSNYLKANMDTFISRFKRKQRIFSALMIDVEKFSYINETFGALTGDEILRKVANVLEETLRPTDMIFRHEGDNFIVILEDTSEEFLKTVADRILERMENTVLSDEKGNFHRVNLLIGALPYSGEEQATFLKKLDGEIIRMKNAYER